MAIRSTIALCAIVLVAVPCATIAADEQDEAVEGQRCINARTIRRTEVVNDDIVIFHLQGGRIYGNTLVKTCKGLSRDKRFSFVTHTRSLCAHDRINVLKESGAGVYEGRSCKLGRFWPMTNEDLEEFHKQLQKVPDPEPVELPPVQDVIGTDGTDAEDPPE